MYGGTYYAQPSLLRGAPTRMKFRIPELFLGAFLAVAVFAMGMMFALHNSGAPAHESGSEFWSAKLTDWLLAAFTALLVAFTYRLWKSTDKLWEAGERQLRHLESTAQRQLRAYITADISDIDLRGPEGALLVKLGINIKNTGQTPAHKVAVVSRTHIVEHPIQMPFDFTLISGPDPGSSVLGAGQSIESESIAERPFGGDETMRARSSEGGFRIYTWGRVTYSDVFGAEHYTNFCASLIFHDGEVAAHASEHHNDAS